MILQFLTSALVTYAGTRETHIPGHLRLREARYPVLLWLMVKGIMATWLSKSPEIVGPVMCWGRCLAACVRLW